MKATIAGLVAIWLTTGSVTALFWPWYWGFSPAASVIISICETFLALTFSALWILRDEWESKS